MQKRAGRVAATLGGMLPTPLGDKAAYLLSEKDSSMPTYLGQTVGVLSGAALGLPLHYLAGFEHNPMSTALPFMMLGGGLGAYIGHGKDTKKASDRELQFTATLRDLKQKLKDAPQVAKNDVNKHLLKK